MACKRSRVRISLSPPRFALTSYAWRSHAEIVRAKRALRSLQAKHGLYQQTNNYRIVAFRRSTGLINKPILISYNPKKMHYTYILKSIPNPDQSYIGYTSNLKQRLEDHNSGKSSHTSKFNPWSLEFYCAFNDKYKALEFEKYLKSNSGKAFAKKHF